MLKLRGISHSSSILESDSPQSKTERGQMGEGSIEIRNGYPKNNILQKYNSILKLQGGRTPLPPPACDGHDLLGTKKRLGFPLDL